MCIKTRIERAIAEKEALDARIAKLELLIEKTAPAKKLLTELLAGYSQEAPEDLAAVWEEILTIGQQHNLSVQPLAADELKAWEAANSEIEEKLKDEADKLRGAIAISNLAAKSLATKKLEKSQQITPGFDEDLGGEAIPALTLWQPWASLIQHEVKLVETRSWGTNYRGPIAIHAAKKPVSTSDYPELFKLLPDNCDVPLGAVVAIANLIDCVEMTPEFIAQQSPIELKCGDWQPGRFAWMLELVRLVVPPISATGGQKLWNWLGTSIEAEKKYLEESKLASNNLEEACDTIEDILRSKGFFQPEDLEDFDEKYETYRGWDIYYSLPNGGIVAIGLYDAEYNQPWECSTEIIEDLDPTFPNSLADFDGIVRWTRALVDQVENLEVPGQLALEFTDPTPEQSAKELTKLQKLLTNNSNFTFEELGVSVNLESVIAQADDTVDFASEETRITVSDENGKSREYYEEGETFVYRNSLTTDGVEQAALGYAQHFLHELKKEGEIKEKVERWNVETLVSNQTIPAPIAEEVSTNTEAETDKTGATLNNFLEFPINTMGVQAQVYPQYVGGNNLMGVTFRFLSLEEKGVNGKPKVVYSMSLLAAELGDRDYKLAAIDIISAWHEKEAARLEKIANPYKKPEDDFVELVKLSNDVAYLKRRDNGELIAAYAAFSNASKIGGSTKTKAKSRTKKWAEWLTANFHWECGEPRVCKRMKSDTTIEFAYELKITKGFSIGQLKKLAEEDFDLLPGEVVSVIADAGSASQVFRLYINSYEDGRGTEEEMRSRFEEELKILGGSQMSVSLFTGSEKVELYRVSDFSFVQAKDFDLDNPEFEVVHLPSQLQFRVHRDIPSAVDSSVAPFWRNSVYPYSGFAKREAAAVDAVRRLLKTQIAE